jgi:hypothetical protein
LNDPDVRSKVVVARDSGWGDDYYYYHLECEAHSGLTGYRREIPLYELDRSRWHCYHCHYGLDDRAHPDAPRELA